MAPPTFDSTTHAPKRESRPWAVVELGQSALVVCACWATAGAFAGGLVGAVAEALRPGAGSDLLAQLEEWAGLGGGRLLRHAAGSFGWASTLLGAAGAWLGACWGLLLLVRRARKAPGGSRFHFRVAEAVGAVVLFSLALAAIQAPRYWPFTPANDDIDPALAAMLAGPAEGDSAWQSPFFAALASLAGPDGQEFLAEPAGPLRGVDAGHAMVVAARGRNYTVVALRGSNQARGGGRALHLLLFSHSGALLDVLSFAVDERLAAGFRAESPAAGVVELHCDHGKPLGWWSYDLRQGADGRWSRVESMVDGPPGGAKDMPLFQVVVTRGRLSVGIW